MQFNSPADMTVQMIARFVQRHKLCEEVKIGLRMLRPDSLCRILESQVLDSKLQNSNDRDEIVMHELQRLDGEVEAMVRKLRGKGRSKHRKRRSHGRSHRHNHNRTQSSSRSQSSNSDSTSDASRNWKRHRHRHHGRRKETSLQDTPDVSHSQTRMVRDPATWLSSLDSGRGTMMQYLQPLQQHFSDVSELTAVLLPAEEGGSLLTRIDPRLFELLGISQLGHRLLLAKGILALSNTS